MKNIFKHGICGLLMFICFNVTAKNTARYLILGDPPLTQAPYSWINKDRKLILLGISDEKGHAIIEQQAGVSDYYLVLWNGTQFPVRINQRCWQKQQEKFETCVEIGRSERTPEAVAEDQKIENAIIKKKADQKLSADWVYDEIKPEQVNGIIDHFLSEHDTWWQKNQAKVNAQITSNTFNCVQLNSDLVKKAPVADLNRNLGDADRTRKAYINAAKNGNWIAASRLAIEMLDNQNWESALPVIAWMIHRKVPAAYNRMADLIGDSGGYESGHLSIDAKTLVESLKWHGALLGDPSSQMAIAQQYKDKKSLADIASKCAQGQRPDYQN